MSQPEYVREYWDSPEPFFEHWDVLVTGTCLSEAQPFEVERLPAMVATIHPRDHKDYQYFKVWPQVDNHPGLPENHSGKLWFSRDSVVIAITDENGDSVQEDK